jgi:hypothetical protein
VQTFPEVPQKSSQQTQADTTNAPAKPPLLAGRPGVGAGATGRPDVKRESLGTDMIEGVEAEGWRTTITTAVGVIGNDKPLTRVCETWHAVELKTLLLSQCSDVRSGRSTMRLKNLDRSEPDPSLFQVPPDYTIVDDRDRFTMNFNER